MHPTPIFLSQILSGQDLFIRGMLQMITINNVLFVSKLLFAIINKRNLSKRAYEIFSRIRSEDILLTKLSILNCAELRVSIDQIKATKVLIFIQSIDHPTPKYIFYPEKERRQPVSDPAA